VWLPAIRTDIRVCAHHILVDGNPEGQGDLLRDQWTSPRRIPLFHATTAATTSCVGPFGLGFVRTLDESSKRYFRFVNARWSLKSVEGFRRIAKRTSPARAHKERTYAGDDAISEAEMG
jgi:hypothetical protein